MANFDISRVIFDPHNHYSSVRMQQGRVITDDDWNEERTIAEEQERRAQVDIIGRHGTPDNGFKIEGLITSGGFINFQILKGTMYVGGLRFEMDQIETFRLQKDWLQKDDDDYLVPTLATGEERFDLVYLETWQHPVSAVEDDSLFEKALGVDTTTRLRKQRRVKIFEDTGSSECPVSWKKLRDDWSADNLGTINKENELIADVTMQVSFAESGMPDDLCSPAIAGGYLGAENQAIRVQITDFDHALNTGLFTWGFDNASPLYRIAISASGDTIQMISLPKDQHHWPIAGQVVEILPWSAVLPNNEKIAEHAGLLAKVAVSYNPDTASFVIASPVPAAFGMDWTSREDENELQEPAVFLYMRVWSRGADLASNETISFTPGTPVQLGGTGLQVNFTGNDFTLPDQWAQHYWVVAARPATPEQVVPWELTTTGIPPHGPRFFLAPLAIIHWTNNGEETVGEIIHDCRKRFSPLTADECCCTYTVGDGIYSKGDYCSIQEAIDNLPLQGGKICVLQGTHEAAVLIKNRRQVHISGCGDQTVIRAKPNDPTPIFSVQHSQRIRFDNMILVTIDGTAIEVEDLSPKDVFPPSEEITVRDTRILAYKHAVRVSLQEDSAGDNNIKILYNLIGMFDKPGGDVAIFSVADDVLIERNRIAVIPNVPEDPDRPDDDQPPGDVNDPCADSRKIYTNARFRLLVERYLRFLNAFVPKDQRIEYQATGGIQIGCGSERIWILENEIIGGKGAGILLGHWPVPPGAEVFDVHFPALYQISIDRNTIQLMGIAGIAPFTIPSFNNQDTDADIIINDISIYRNNIMYCALQVPEQFGNSMVFGGIILPFCDDGMIQENRIENNGRSQVEPVCGIFILHGERIDISNNRIVNNGPRKGDPDKMARSGRRGGVVIRMSFKSLDLFPKSDIDPTTGGITNMADATRIPTFDAVPAVKVHDNIIVQPLGHALFLMAFGPVSVVSNQLTSQGTFRRDLYSLLAGSVFIFNLGISKDLLNIVFASMGKLKNLPFVSPSTLFALLADPNSTLGKFFQAYQLLPSGKVMFASNQTTLDLRSTDRSLAISSQLIVSLDDIAFNNNQSECVSFVSRLQHGVTLDIVLLNTLLVGVSLRANDNRFTDGFSLTLLSLLSMGSVNTSIDNQATHCIIAIGVPAFTNKLPNTVLLPTLCKDKVAPISNHYGYSNNKITL